MSFRELMLIRSVASVSRVNRKLIFSFHFAALDDQSPASSSVSSNTSLVTGSISSLLSQGHHDPEGPRVTGRGRGGSALAVGAQSDRRERGHAGDAHTAGQLPA